MAVPLLLVWIYQKTSAATFHVLTLDILPIKSVLPWNFLPFQQKTLSQVLLIGFISAHVTSQCHDVERTMQLLRDAAIMTLRHEHVVQSVASWPRLESVFFARNCSVSRHVLLQWWIYVSNTVCPFLDIQMTHFHGI